MQPIKAYCKNATLLFCFAIMLLAVSIGAQAQPQQTSHSAQSNSDVCPGTRVDLTTVAFTPYIRLNVAGKEGWFVIDSGSSYSVIDSSVVSGAMLNQFVKLNMAGFPYVESEQFRVADLSTFPSPRGEGAIGIIGENILSLVSVQFQYDTDSAHIVVSPNACSPYLANNPDFVEINETGYYVRDRMHLNPGELNVPHLGVKVGTVSAPVYLDSGNADGGRTRSIGSIMMNSAFIDALNEAHIQIDPEDVYTAVACPSFHPIVRTQTHWKVRAESLEITNRHEEVLKQYKEPTIDSLPPECSGLFSNPGPFGLIGASYFYRWGTVILDAPGERVWIRKGVDKDVSTLPRYVLRGKYFCRQ